MANKIVLTGTFESSKKEIGTSEPININLKSIKRLKRFIKRKSKT